MRVEVAGKPYQITFQHVIHPWLEFDDNLRHLVRGYTTALLYSGTNGYQGVLDKAYTACSASDNFCKETGRKVALRRLLENVRWDREARRAVWQAYWRSKGVERG